MGSQEPTLLTVLASAVAVVGTLVGLVVWMVKRRGANGNGNGSMARIENMIDLHEQCAEMEADDRALQARISVLDREQQHQRRRCDEINAVLSEAIAQLRQDRD